MKPQCDIYLMDDPGTIIRKCKRAVTDSEAQILYRDEQPGIKNLIDIYGACTGKTPEEVVKEFDGKGYGDFKLAVGESVVSVLKPLRNAMQSFPKIKVISTVLLKIMQKKQDTWQTRLCVKYSARLAFPIVSAK